MLDDSSIDQRREAVAFGTPAKRKSALGQFMTPSPIANFMAGMFSPLGSKKICLLDAGAGIGSLTAAFTQRAVRDNCISLQCEAWELDNLLHAPLHITLNDCELLAQQAGVKFQSDVQTGDFIVDYSSLFSVSGMDRPTHAILNPPYKKISSASVHRRVLRAFGVETSNLYSAFVALALKSLKEGGELVAITPRSFCNGTYFRPFRELLLNQAAVTQIHMFGSRTHAFKSDEVLQENIIFHLVKGRKQGPIILSMSEDATFSEITVRSMAFSEFVVSPNSPKWNYQISPHAKELLQTFGTKKWKKALAEYKSDVGSLAESYKKKRDLNLVPCRLPDGSLFKMSPGGHSELIRNIIEEFAPRFVPGAQVLYVGDTGNKGVVHETEVLEKLGVAVHERGKMPDAILYLAERIGCCLLRV